MSNRLEPLVPDIRFETLHNLPNIIGGFARRIEKINSSNFIHPRTVLVRWFEPNLFSAYRAPEPLRTWIKTGTNVQKAQAFEILPSLLRDYAHYLRFALKCSTGRPRRYSDQQIGKIRLLMHLKERTRKSPFELAAKLLWSTFIAAGVKNEDTGRSLRDL